jgi:hypothetical protein
MILLFFEINSSNIFQVIGDKFSQFANQVIGNPLLIGILVFLFIFFLCSVLLIPFEAMVIIFIPACFIIALWIPLLQLVCAILVGITIGLGLLKWIRG